MDLENLYPLNRPYLSENRTKRTKNPFTYDNVSGALGVLINRKKLLKIELSSASFWRKRTGAEEWELFSSWIDDSRNLPTVYRRLLALPAAGGTPGTETGPKADILWAGNVTGFVWLALYTWNDGDEHMMALRRRLKEYAKNDNCTARLLADYIRKLNANGLQIIQSYEPTGVYCSRFRTFKTEDHHMENENYRKALFVDTVAQVLRTVKTTAPDLLDIYGKSVKLENDMIRMCAGMYNGLLTVNLNQAMTANTGGNLQTTVKRIRSELRRIDWITHGSV